MRLVLGQHYSSLDQMNITYWTNQWCWSCFCHLNNIFYNYVRPRCKESLENGWYLPYESDLHRNRYLKALHISYKLLILSNSNSTTSAKSLTSFLILGLPCVRHNNWEQQTYSCGLFEKLEEQLIFEFINWIQSLALF